MSAGAEVEGVLRGTRGWGRDPALWLGRKHGRLTLQELGERAGAMNSVAVGQALGRFARRLEQEARLRGTITELEDEM